MIATWMLMQDWLLVQRPQTPAEARRAFVLQALGVRFAGATDPDLANRVLAEDDPEVLARWVDRAMLFPSLEAVRAIILPPGNSNG
jgi:hypothetical protein